MAVEQQPEIGAPAAGALAIRPSTQILMLLRTPIDRPDSPSSGAVALATLSLISQHPKVVSEVIKAVYQHPDLLAAQREPALRGDLATIQQLYPSVIGFFTDNRIKPFIADDQSERIQEIKDFVGGLPGGQTVQTIEVVLGILIEDGSGTNLDPSTYPAIRASHELFGRLSETIYNANSLSLKEDKHFMQIGMRLLNARRTFEINLETAAATYGRSPVSREADFNGKLGQLRAIGMMIRNLQAAEKEPTNPLTRGQTEEMVRGLGASLRLIDDELRIYHPDKYPDLQKTLGLEEGEKLRRWAEHPGGPQFSPSESQDFLHSR